MLDDLIESALKNLSNLRCQEIYDPMTDSQRIRLRFDSAATTSSTLTNIPFQWPPTTLWFYDRQGNFLWDKVMPWKPLKELPSTYAIPFPTSRPLFWPPDYRSMFDDEVKIKRFRYCYKVDQVAIYQEED